MVTVYDCCNGIMGSIPYNQNLDYTVGTDSFNGQLGRHLGIDRFKTGENKGAYVLIHGSDNNARRDWAEVISEETAYKIIKKYNPELFKENKFSDLQKKYGDNNVLEE